MIKITTTGHRPSNKNLGGYNIYSLKNLKIQNRMRKEIIKIIEDNPIETDFHFISGMALGIDTMFFLAAQKVKDTYEDRKLNITLEAAAPFKNQSIKWFNKNDIDRYNELLSLSNKITFVDTLEEYKIKDYQEDVYYPAKMQKRNEYMVDNSDYIIAVWDGSKGGTGNCYKYAEKQDIKIVRINPKEII